MDRQLFGKLLVAIEGGYDPVGPTMYGIDARSWPAFASRIRAKSLTLEAAITFYETNFITQCGSKEWAAVFDRCPGLAMALLFNLIQGAPGSRKGVINDAYDLLALQGWYQKSSRRISGSFKQLAAMSASELQAVAKQLYLDYPKMYAGRLDVTEGSASKSDGLKLRWEKERSFLLVHSRNIVESTLDTLRRSVVGVKEKLLGRDKLAAPTVKLKTERGTTKVPVLDLRNDSF